MTNFNKYRESVPYHVLWKGWYLLVVGGGLIRGDCEHAGAQHMRKNLLSRIFSAAFRRSRATRPAHRLTPAGLAASAATTSASTTKHNRMLLSEPSSHSSLNYDRSPAH
ncbi:unnamed protein product [Euphydryas editha]|uniref:Uncharacterized protein n=1 Tax=Euphydryas editha TaxID=104508 RepID=A0AAU9V4X7_EUPED|nr:unnamed protein product [Euphydryas editha]